MQNKNKNIKKNRKSEDFRILTSILYKHDSTSASAVFYFHKIPLVVIALLLNNICPLKSLAI
jgi:hypothetical protein